MNDMENKIQMELVNGNIKYIVATHPGKRNFVTTVICDLAEEERLGDDYKPPVFVLKRKTFYYESGYRKHTNVKNIWLRDFVQKHVRKEELQ